jgi:hypothetical protein
LIFFQFASPLSHPFQSRGKNVFLYISKFTFLDSKRKKRKYYGPNSSRQNVHSMFIYYIPPPPPPPCNFLVMCLYATHLCCWHFRVTCSIISFFFSTKNARKSVKILHIIQYYWAVCRKQYNLCSCNVINVDWNWRMLWNGNECRKKQK